MDRGTDMDITTARNEGVGRKGRIGNDWVADAQCGVTINRDLTTRNRDRCWRQGPAALQLLVLGLLALVTSAAADPAQGDLKKLAAPVSPYVFVSHIGDADQQISLKDGNLLAHRRATDPFGLAVAGKFKGLPQVAEHPQAGPGPAAVSNKLALPDGLTLEKAIQQLPLGAVSLDSREALIGSRSVHEGDLLVLELAGHQFVVWVQSIDRRGVQFCDVDLKQHALRPFRLGPGELPDDTAVTQTQVRDFLKSDAN